MPLVDADDPLVEDLLHGMLELLREAGGWVHPHAVITANDGALGIRCAADDDLLLSIPAAVWLPVDRFSWPDLHLAPTAAFDDLDDLALPMATLHIALLGACGKLQEITTGHPSVADLPDAVVTATQAIVPDFRTGDRNPMQVLFATRCFRISTGRGAGERMLIPYVDLLDHHARGASARLADGVFEVPIAHPWGDATCALDYGMQRDALEMAVVYGFPDASAEIAHSAPCTISVDGRPIHIARRGRAADGALLPLTITADAEPVISGLTFACDDPDRPVQALIGAGLAEAEARRIAQAVTAANHQLIDELIAACSTDSGEAAECLAAAAAVQARAFTIVR